MFLKRLELQGFKTFAQKTSLEFLPDSQARRGVTAVVGPNGSGKSNIADAIRWVMGEQSLKLLRGKKSEDVIFSGTTERARSGFAEVSLILENEDGPAQPAGLPAELVITRRLYRDGQSDYLVNREAARLQDVALLLAQAGVSQRSYSVIGQGMIDQALVASPAERKEFFDEAFGLRPFQLKRQAALSKLDASRVHLTQSEALLREIEPRLSSLSRQVKRLQERDQLTRELAELERAWYGARWRELNQAYRQAQERALAAQADQAKCEGEARQLEETLDQMEKNTPVRDGFQALRQTLDDLNAERNHVREQQLVLETQRAVAAVRAEKPWSPLPLTKIIERLDAMHARHQALCAMLEQDAPDPVRLRAWLEELRGASADLIGKLQRPAPEPEQATALDPEIEQASRRLAQAMFEIQTRTEAAQKHLATWNQTERDQRQHIFDTQHRLNQKRHETQAAERRASDLAVEAARIETRREGFLAEVRQQAAALETELDQLAAQPAGAHLGPEVPARLQRLRAQLEWIGGIDPQTVKEYEDTKTRFDFLHAQVKDVQAGIADLETVLSELDQTIRTRATAAFQHLNCEFNRFFKQLFAGGEAGLVEVEPEPELDEQGRPMAEAAVGDVAGIEIQATPPGKRFKSIALLSGGERALTSIALICAIMATNPSPFIVLDEVDAALDESNSRKFGEIIHELADKTQFIVITHNRATMLQAHVLYGVTMGTDGVSQLLSVKFADVEKLRQQAV